jgi:pimeloyl-ACP methyl ester carboxylesterase
MVSQRRVRGAALSLFVTEYGERGRPTVVLVHGFPDTSAVWAPVADRLASDFHVVAYDVRGAGRSDAPAKRDGYALPNARRRSPCGARPDQPDAPVHLVAHDLGSVQAWEAITTKGLATRIANLTSVSVPPLDHAGMWARDRRSLPPADLRQTIGQALHSRYTAYFHLPLLPELMARSPLAAAPWSAGLHPMEQAPTVGHWPAATFGTDFAHRVEPYRANVRSRLRHPVTRHSDVSVRLLVPLRDRYVRPRAALGPREVGSLMWRRPVDAGHWAIRTNPDDVARWVREVVAYVENRTETAELRRWRVELTRPAA